MEILLIFKGAVPFFSAPQLLKYKMDLAVLLVVWCTYAVVAVVKTRSMRNENNPSFRSCTTKSTSGSTIGQNCIIHLAYRCDFRVAKVFYMNEEEIQPIQFLKL